MIGHDAPRHSHHAEKEHREEGDVEAHEHRPEVDRAQSLVQAHAPDLRSPEIQGGEDCEHRAAADRVVEVRDQEVAAVRVVVDRRRGQEDSGDAADQKIQHEADHEQHRRFVGDRPAPHRCDPVEEFDPGRDGDQERHGREERIVDRTGGEHVMGPDAHREPGDRKGREDETGVAEDRLAREHRDDLGDDAEEGQDQHVDFGVAEPPEQVLVENRVAAAVAARRRNARPPADRRAASRAPR